MKTISIGWLNKCRCGNKSHTVKTARGNETALWDDDAVKCNSCGREGVIQVCEDQARVLWETDEEMSERKPMTITKERLEQYAYDKRMCNINDEIREMARMALAGMEADQGRNPVLAYADSYREMAKQGVESIPVWSVITDLERNIAPHFTSPQPLTTSERAELENYRNAQQVVPDGLHPETASLVIRFSSALAEKLYMSEKKYGWSDNWMRSDWYEDCLQSLWEHIEKGDPRDVAAYCAFMWHHGWVTTDYDRNVQSACRAAMQSGAVKDGWVACSERMPEESGRYWCYVEEQNSLGEARYQWNCSWNGDVWGGEMMYGRVTHWQPLPAAPQQEAE